MKFVILSCLVIQAFGIIPFPEEALERYSEKKAWKACIGSRVADEVALGVANAVEQCNHIPSLLSGHQGFDPRNQGNPFLLNSILGRPLPQGGPNLFELSDELPNLPSGIGLQPLRQKRQASPIGIGLNARDLLAAEDRIRARLSNFTCVTSALNLMDNQGNIKFSTIAQSVANLNLNNFFKQDLLETINDCASTASCLVGDRRTSLVPFEIKRMIGFLQCVKNRKQVDCMKQDIRQYLVAGLPPNVNPSFNLQETVERIAQVKLAEPEFEELDLFV